MLVVRAHDDADRFRTHGGVGAHLEGFGVERVQVTRTLPCYEERRLCSVQRQCTRHHRRFVAPVIARSGLRERALVEDAVGRRIQHGDAVRVRVNDPEPRTIRTDGEWRRVRLLRAAVGRRHAGVRTAALDEDEQDHSRASTRHHGAVPSTPTPPSPGSEGGTKGVNSNVIEFASAAGSPAAEISGTQS